MKDLIFRNEKKVAYSLMILAGVFLTIILLVLAFYNHPSADDYDCTMVVKQQGFFAGQYYWYMQWYGRFFSSALVSLNPLIIGSFTGYKLMGVLVILLTLASFYYFINAILRTTSRFEKLFLTFLCFSTFFLLMPSPVQCYYWFTSAYTYQTSNILTLFLLMMMISKEGKPGISTIVISSLLVMAIAGSNEFAMFVLMMMLSFINLYRFILEKKIHRVYFILLIAGVAGTLIVFLAPGNTYRASFATNNFQIIFSVKSAIQQTFDVLSHWWWIGLFIMLASYTITVSKITELTEKRFGRIYLNPFLILFFMFLVIAAGFFTCYFSLGVYPPLRTINNIYFYFIIGSVYTGICMAIMVKKNKINIPDIPFIQIVIVLLLLVYVFKFNNNIKTAWHDLKDGTAANYNRELNERYKEILSDNSRTCKVRKLQNKPKTLVFTDISDETDVVMINTYANYFNKDSVQVELK